MTMTTRPFPVLRLAAGCLALVCLTLTSVPAEAVDVNAPIALVADDPQVAGRLHQALRRRFPNILLWHSPEAAQEGARRPGGPWVAILVTTDRDSGSATAYGNTMPICDATVSVQILRLPNAALVGSKSTNSRKPSCGRALDVASGALSDWLVQNLELYRRHGRPEDREQDFFWVELAEAWPPAELDKLRAGLLEIPGIEAIAEHSDPYLLELQVYREPRYLARELEALPMIRVRRVSGRRAVLARSQSPGQPAPQRSRQAPVPQVETDSAHHGRKWALIVGISHFQDPEIRSLAYPVRDAEAFADVLKDTAVGRFAPDSVKLLLDQQATTRRLKGELDYLARETEPEDLFLFFFSSHAVGGEHDTAGDAYLITHDTEIADRYATGFAMRELVDALSHRIRARTVVGLLDACESGEVVHRSGSVFNGSKGLVYEPTLSWSEEWQTMSRSVASAVPAGGAAGQGKHIVLITSSDGDQLSWESERLRHGVFTYHLMEALRRSQGQAPLGSIFDKVRAAVRETVQLERREVQEPRMFVNQETDLIIGYEVE